MSVAAETPCESKVFPISFVSLEFAIFLIPFFATGITFLKILENRLPIPSPL